MAAADPGSRWPPPSQAWLVNQADLDNPPSCQGIGDRPGIPIAEVGLATGTDPPAVERTRALTYSALPFW